MEGKLSAWGRPLESVLAITTPQRRRLIEDELRRLGADVGGMQASRRLVFLDAQATLARVTANGQPDWPRFEKTIRAAIRGVAPGATSEALRVLHAHTHVLPSDTGGTLEIALDRSMDELLGPEAQGLRERARGDVGSEGTVISNAEGRILRLRENLPAEADRILRRAREYQSGQLSGAHQVAIDAARGLAAFGNCPDH